MPVYMVINCFNLPLSVLSDSRDAFANKLLANQVVHAAMDGNVHHGGFFYQRVNCTGMANLTVFTKHRRKPVNWIRVTTDGTGIYAHAKGPSDGIHPVCVGNRRQLCRCLNLRIKAGHIRTRTRRNADSALHNNFRCPSSAPVTKVALVLDGDYTTLTAAQKDSTISAMATFMQVARDQVKLTAASGIFFTSNLQQHNFLTNAAGNYQGAVSKTMQLQSLIGCGELTSGDAKVLKVTNGVSSLSQAIGYQIIRLYVVSGTVPVSRCVSV